MKKKPGWLKDWLKMEGFKPETLKEPLVFAGGAAACKLPSLERLKRMWLESPPPKKTV